MIYMGEIKEEEVKFDLSGQGEILRRLCFWLELQVDLGREHLMLSIDKKLRLRRACFGSAEKTDKARKQDVVGDNVGW